MATHICVATTMYTMYKQQAMEEMDLFGKKQEVKVNAVLKIHEYSTVLFIK